MEPTRWSMINNAKAGDEAAFGDLVGRYRPPVIAYLVRCGLSRSDAEDLAQEVFVELFRRVLPQADAARGRFRALLLTLTKSTLQSWWRARAAKKRGGCRKHVPLHDAPEPSLQSDAIFDREWLGHLLTRALDRLEQRHPNYHSALVLSLLEGLSYGQIAAQLGVSEGSVRNNLHRGKKKVAEYLEGEVGRYAADPQEHQTEVALLNDLLRG